MGKILEEEEFSREKDKLIYLSDPLNFHEGNKY